MVFYSDSLALKMRLNCYRGGLANYKQLHAAEANAFDEIVGPHSGRLCGLHDQPIFRICIGRPEETLQCRLVAATPAIPGVPTQTINKNRT